MKRVMLDQGSGVEIMYPDLYKGLNLRPEDLTAYDSPLVSFDEKLVILRGQIRLPVQAGSEVVEVDFIMVDAYSPYMAIVAKPWLHALRAVSSTLHQKVKCSLKGQIKEIVGSQSTARQCLVVAILHQPEDKSSASTKRGLQQLKDPELLINESAEEAKCGDLETVIVGDDLEKFFQIRAQLPPLEKEQLIKFLRRKIDIFAWNAYKALRVDSNFICYHLNVNPSVTPKRQPPQRSSKDHSNAVKDEVMKFKQTGAIKEVFYPKWLANTMVVKKKNGKWQVCVDFTDLNNACPKDLFLMPKIDQLVDATVGHPWMSFLNAFQGYHQVPLALGDQEKIAFFTPTRNYHYKVMPFGLKNAGSTDQRMMTRMFEPQLGKSIGVYIDDMVVKSKVAFEHVGDFGNIFEILKKHKLRLNASKCFFSVGSSKFLGYMVTHLGIEINPDQIQVINNLQPPRNPKKSKS